MSSKKDVKIDLKLEFVGCFFLIFITLLSAFTAPTLSVDISTLVYVSLTYGLAYASVLYCILLFSAGKTLPSQFNPALTLCLFLLNKISFKIFIQYCIVQCISSFTGLFIVWLLLTSSPKYQTLEVLDQVSTGQQMLMNVLVSFLALLVVVVTIFPASKQTSNNENPVPSPATKTMLKQNELEQLQVYNANEINSITCGLTTFFCCCIGTTLSGGYMNPLMGICVAIIEGKGKVELGSLLGPLIGSLLVAASVRLVKLNRVS